MYDKLFQVYFRLTSPGEQPREGSKMLRAKNKPEAKRKFWEQVREVGIDKTQVVLVACNRINEHSWQTTYVHGKTGRVRT